MNKETQMEHLVGMIPRNKLDLWRVRIEAGRGVGRPGTVAWQFHGEVILIVEDGCVEAEIGTESFVLEAGDSIHFDSNIPHRWIAGAGKPAVVMVLAMIPSRLQADLVSRIASASAIGMGEGSIEASSGEEEIEAEAASGGGT